MNILYIADLRSKSVHDIKWIKHLSQGHKVYAICREEHHVQLNDQDQKTLDDLHITYLGSIRDFSIRHFYKNFYTAWVLKKWIKKHNIDLLHIMYAEPNALWAFFKAYLGVSIFLTTRGTDVLKAIPAFFARNSLFGSLVSYLYKRSFNNIDWIFSTSSGQIESIKKLFNRSKNVEIVRTGVDFELLNSDTSSYLPAKLKGIKYVFFPRNMAALYNHSFSLNAIKQLPLYIKEKYAFVFVDKTSTHLEYVQQIASEIASIKDTTIYFLPQVSQKEMIELYKNCSLVVMNPLSDGSPVSAMEAMTLKKPVIVGPLNYDTVAFEYLTKLQAWSEQELAHTIENILSNPADAAYKIDKAYETAVSLFDTKKEMSKIRTQYDNVIRSR